MSMFLEILSCYAQSGWQNLNSGTTRNLKGLYFLNEQVGWVCGEGGLIKKTTDGGNSWFIQRDGGNHLYNIQFVDENIGFALGGGDPPPTSPILLKTTDGGNSWTVLNTTSPYTLVGLFFINAQVGWVTGYYGTIRKTTDGGQTWTTQTSPGGYWFHDIQFINENVGWICGEGSRIHKTTDGGKNWVSQDNHGYSYAHWVKLSIIDENNLFIVGYMGSGGGKIINTTNSGIIWTVVYDNNADAYSCVNFVNNNLGWVSSWYGNILVSTNGGVSWSKQLSGTTNGLNKLQMLNENVGYVVGYNGTILKTTSGGVIDNIPPEIAVLLFPKDLYELWPPNHKLWTVQASVNATDNLPGVSFILKSIVSTEPDMGLGFDDVAGDIQNAEFGTPDLSFDLRAERYGTGDGRTYTITYEATDAAGNKAQAIVNVLVKHSQAQNEGHPDVSDKSNSNNGIEIKDIYPNPFDNNVKIILSESGTGIVDVSIYNYFGQKVKTIMTGFVPDGIYERIWDGTDENNHYLSNGIYFLRALADGEIKFVRNIILNK